LVLVQHKNKAYPFSVFYPVSSICFIDWFNLVWRSLCFSEFYRYFINIFGDAFKYTI